MGLNRCCRTFLVVPQSNTGKDLGYLRLLQWMYSDWKGFISSSIPPGCVKSKTQHAEAFKPHDHVSPGLWGGVWQVGEKEGVCSIGS